MNKHKELSAAGRRYAEAHASHYADRDLLLALQSYENVITLHPSAPEAGYSRSQIRNIVNLVVPAEELLTVQIEIALHHLESDVHDAATVA